MTNDERDTLIRQTHDTVIRMEQFTRDHADNDVIHQVPPCESHKTLIARLWGVAVLSVASAFGALWALLK